jgi:glucose-1-phosphate adenylyltransferase
MTNVLAMVLAAGRVDELLTLTERRPKSAVPVFGIYRIIDFALSNLMHSGLRKVGVLSQFRPHALTRHIGSGEHWDFIGRSREIRILPPYRGLAESDWYKGTADAIYQNMGYIEEFQPEDVLIVSADHIYRMDYRPFYQYHRDKNAEATVCLTRVTTPEKRFGYATLDRRGIVVEYQEKPATPPSHYASMTVYLFKTSLLLNLLKDNSQQTSHEFGRDILPSLAAQKRLVGYRFKGTWTYARTVNAYYAAHQALLKRNIDLNAWQVRTNLIERCEHADRVPARISGKVKNSIVSEGCIIEGKVKNSVLSPGVHIYKGSSVNNSIIFHDTCIKEKSILNKVICDKDVHIGDHVHIGTFGEDTPSQEFGHLMDSGFTLIGKGIQVPNTMRIGANTSIFSTACLNQDSIAPGSTVR